MVSAGSNAGHRRAHEKFKISTMLGQNGKTAKRQNGALSHENIRRVGLLSWQNHHIKDRDNTGVLRLVDRCKLFLCRGLCACGILFYAFSNLIFPDQTCFT